MSFDKKELAKSLKILATAPAEIEKQKQAYRDKMKEIDAEERKGIWGKVTLDGRRKEALKARNDICNRLVDSMVTAYNFVVTNNNYADSETIDFDNARLQNVLKMIDIMGKDMSATDQMAILSEFRGNIGALRVIEKSFAKNGLYMKSAAREMQKPVPEEALDQMERVLNKAVYAKAGGMLDFNFDICKWTHSAFGKQLEKLGLDSDADPYAAVLDAAAGNLSTEINELELSNLPQSEKASAISRKKAELLRLQLTKDEVRKARENGENPASMINRQLSKMEMPTEAAQ